MDLVQALCHDIRLGGYDLLHIHSGHGSVQKQGYLHVSFCQRPFPVKDGRIPEYLKAVGLFRNQTARPAPFRHPSEIFRKKQVQPGRKLPDALMDQEGVVRHEAAVRLFLVCGPLQDPGKLSEGFPALFLPYPVGDMQSAGSMKVPAAVFLQGRHLPLRKGRLSEGRPHKVHIRSGGQTDPSVHGMAQTDIGIQIASPVAGP